MIALSAKMAKADGIVNEAEVSAFRDIFKFPADQAKNVARLYNLARQDVAGYEAYAEKMASLCSSCERNCPILEESSTASSISRSPTGRCTRRNLRS